MTKPLNIPQSKIDAIFKSPEFLTEFNKQCEKIDVNLISLPVYWHNLLIDGIKNKSFNELQKTYQLLPAQFAAMYNNRYHDLLIIKISASIILSLTTHEIEISGYNYAEIVTDVTQIIDQCNAIFDDVSKSAVQTIHNRNLLSGKL
jgi:hypothetical protein